MKELFISVFIILSTKKPNDFITTNSFHKSIKKGKKSFMEFMELKMVIRYILTEDEQ